MSLQDLSGLPDTLKEETIDNDQIYYQILLVSPDNRISEKRISTTIVTKKKAEFAIKNYLLDKMTLKNLHNYNPLYRGDKRDTIGAYLPSCGVVFPKKFKENLLYPKEPNQDPDFGINNFYQPIQNLLQTRKISQLIAKTWYAYIEAKSTVAPWKNFLTGNWKDVNQSHDNPNLKINLLDGLISREIFYFDKSYSPDHLEPNTLEAYKDCWQKPNINEAFVIPPTSYAWQGIVLSLLLAGQAYYEVEEEGQKKYHQICQPILSTGDIVFRYAIEVEWDQFKGRIHEMELQPGKSSVASRATVPYPPIPWQENLTPQQIQAWAEAEDEGGEYPFYTKEGENYSLDMKYFAPPFPYLPLSTC